MKSGAYYIARAKAKLGNVRMSDRELAEHFGCSISLIAMARRGNMSDHVALKTADLTGDDAGEILMVARLEREKQPEVKEALLAYASKIFASASKSAALALAGLAVTLGLLQPLPAEAFGGAGRPRKRL